MRNSWMCRDHRVRCPKQIFWTIALFCCSMADVSLRTACAENESDVDFFERRVRPILVDRCESCHSAAKGKTSGGLSLDSKDGWIKGGDSGSPVLPGKPDESLLVRAIQYALDGPQMPPKDKGGKLPDGEIATLKEWVSRGAPDTRIKAPKTSAMTVEESRSWWSFQPLRPIDPPTVQHVELVRTDLDRFILVELERRKITPAGPADRRMLLRRATFDLTGLPPTPTEVNAFVNDPSNDAFEQVVDRLLDSPAYGQRWARHWLDIVRYADFHDANPKTRTASCEITEAWRYRDWVVDAFNHDLPFDQFIKHQIAGDLLPNPQGGDVYPAGLIATTFLSNGVWDRGDADKEKIVSDMADDNIDTVGKAFLGLTLGCARCHDHKFDPVSTEDYYGLAGIFYSSHILKELGIKGGEYTMNRVPLVPESVLAQRRQYEEQLKQVQSKLADLAERQRFRDLTSGGSILIPTQFTSTAAATGKIDPTGLISVSGNRAKDTYTIQTTVPEGVDVNFVRIQALTDPGLPRNGPGRSDDGNFVITRFRATTSPPDQPDSATPIKWKSTKASFEQKNFPVVAAIDDNPESGWAIDPAEGRDHVAVFEVHEETKLTAGTILTLMIEQTHSDTHTLGKFRLSVTNAMSSSQPVDESEKIDLEQQQKRLQQEVSVPIPVAMATTEGGMPGGLFPNIQDVPIHIRGSYLKLGPVVARRMPKFLAGENQPGITTGSGRRELANWVASKDNPLTARVIVNRIWHGHFGEGIVRTPNNFGKAGERPTHPALLDWLATKLIEDDWSLKKLHRRIMLSGTYRQSSRIGREIVTQDPDNHWLARFPARRLEAEAIRDATLAVSGQLDQSADGPAGDDFTILRRSLYVQTARWDRSGYAMLFDAANPDSSTEKRIVSTVAPQALMFLNHDFIAAQAKKLAGRLVTEAPDDSLRRIDFAYQLLFGRPATAEESTIAKEIVDSSANDETTGWIDLAHVLLCSNEFVYLD